MDIEDFCAEPGLGRCVEEAINEAREDPEKRRLEVYMTFKEPFAKSGGIGHKRVNPSDTERRALLKSIKDKLLDTLGESPDGVLRLYFRCEGDTQTSYGTFSRTLKSQDEQGDDSSSRTIRELRKYNLQLMQANVDQTNASAKVVSANAEALTGVGEVIKGLNPQATQWWQAAGKVLAPVVAGVIQAKAKGQAQGATSAQQGKGLPPVNVPVKLANGDRVMRLEDGRWIKERGKEDWVYIDPPPEARGAAPTSVPGTIEDTTKADGPPQIEGGQSTKDRLKALAKEDPMNAIEAFKELAQELNLSPDDIAEYLSQEESIDA